MRILKRALFSTIAAIISIPIIYYGLCEAVVYYEMFSTGTSSRAQLGEDLGLGILLFLVVPPGTLIGAIGIWVMTWFQLRKRKDSHATAI